MKLTTLIGGLALSLLSINTMAATVDGSIHAGEYKWNTDGAEGSSKWNNYGGYQEDDDASGGDAWDIEFLGTNVQDGNFQFGVKGGYILTGSETGSDIYLGDIALDVNGDSTNPTMSSAGFDYAIRLLSVDSYTGEAEFALLEGGTWEGADLYGGYYAPNHITDTYRMGDDASLLTTFVGSWALNGVEGNVLEAEFDLSLLGLFDQNLGGVIGTYLTMTCVNDEALVYADIAPVPVPAAVWLFTPALLGLVGIRRRKQK